MSESWALNEQGRLYIPGLTPESISYDTEHRNYSSFYLADTRIDADAIPDPVDWTMPLPLGVWRISTTGKLRMSGGAVPLVGSAPYPIAVWFKDIELNKLHEGGMPYNIIRDAFRNCLNLNKIKIPKSMGSISKLAFEYTALTNVKLPDNCTYYETTFPPDCTVTGGQIIDD